MTRWWGTSPSFTVRRIWLVLGLAAFAGAQQAEQPAVGGPHSFVISGSVVDAASGAPLGNTEVAIAPVTTRDVSQIIKTASDGTFAFTVVQRGKYALTAKRHGYPIQSFDAHEPFSTSIAVGPDVKSEGLLFRIHPESGISGRIIDDQAEPVANAQVMLFQPTSAEGMQRTRLRSRASTDDQGIYHFRRLPAGKYLVAVSATPWYSRESFSDRNRSASAESAEASRLDAAYPMTFYGDATSDDHAGVLNLEWGSHLTADITVLAVPAAHVTIHVSDSRNDQGLSVQMLQGLRDGGLTPASVRYIRTEPDKVEVFGLAPGHYWLQLYHSSGGDGSGRTSDSREVDIAGDTEIDATAPAPSTECSGTVTVEGEGRLSAGLQISLRNLGAGRNGFGQVSPSGEFKCQESITPGSYNVAAFGGQSLLVKSITASGATVRGSRLNISQPGPVSLKVILTKGAGHVDGTVLDDNKPVAGVMVILVPVDPENNLPLFRRDQSDSDGTFTLANVLPGSYTAIAIRDGWDLEWARPEVLARYLPNGQAVQVGANGKYEIKVSAQQK